MSNRAKARPLSKPDKGTVCLGYIHDPDKVSFSWHESMVNLLGWDMANSGRITAGGYVSVMATAAGLVEGRNTVVSKFLADTDADWLFWLDTDMGFAPYIVDQLLESADPVERPVVGALCFMHRTTHQDGMGGYHTTPKPTIFHKRTIDGKTGLVPADTYPVNALVEVHGTGSAAILIHRSVLVDIHDRFGPVWYNRATNPDTGHLAAEDLSFCARVLSIGKRVHVNTAAKTSHHKNLWVQEEQFWDSFQAPPATQRVDILVPVLERPQNAKPFMESLRASTGLANVTAVADATDADTADAWRAAGAHVVQGQAHTFAEKVNAGVALLTPDRFPSPWVFIVGDDVKFHPAWFDQALHVAGDDYDVVGTNDLVNPQVVAGYHATHLLIRRSYIDKVGASWDGPGLIAHEGYNHNFVDNEIVTAAKQRDVWAMALGSKVEHLHPVWGKGESDDTYTKGQAKFATDKKLFEQRAGQFAGAA